MKHYTVEHPSAATERLERWAEIEELLVALKELGWRIERYTNVDEDGEPLRAALRIRYDKPSALEGML